jgi:hypothetical protein
MALIARKARPWQVPPGGNGSFAADGYWLGAGGTPLEVAAATTGGRPAEADVRNVWKRRKGSRPSPLLLVVLWGDRATVCGATGDNPAVYSDRDPDQIARIAELALAEPDQHAAGRLLSAYLPQEAGGVRNAGLFATHHLVERVPRRPDWTMLCEAGVSMLGMRREELVEALGFRLEPRGQAAVLRAGGNARALAVFLDDSENPDASASRFGGMTAVSWAIASAASDNIPFVIVTRGPQLRIYLTRAGAGAAGKGGTSAFLELNLPLLIEGDAGYLPLLFSADSLADSGEFERLLSESQDFAADLGVRLRSRVYDHAVPGIAQALIDRHTEAGGDTDDSALAGLYKRTLLVLFRLLFLAYGEDKGLLPLSTNGLYRQSSLKHLARDLAQLANDHGWENVPFDGGTHLWDRCKDLWWVVDQGRTSWNVPPYNGGMFSTEASVSPEGAALAEIELTNTEFGQALLGLLVDEGDDGMYGPVDFASLDVREFGTIYEGLLESDLAVAPSDLTVDKDNTWLPAGPKDTVLVHGGSVYLHNKSGARKASGSYFTKPFAVNHLLEYALEPALDAHLARLQTLADAGDDSAVADAFFDFRCVDLAMGSGHFLVAAVDRIERRLSEFLASSRTAGVLDELSRLSEAAETNLAAAGVTTDGTDTNTLLRRQIARRCIYGIDLNPTSVELARLALWIHTFVKGLPLTSLDHGLVTGNSLTGIGTLDEAIGVLDQDTKPGKTSLVRVAIVEALESARAALKRFAATSEATAAEVKQARKAHNEAKAAVGPAKQLLNLAVAVRLGDIAIPVAFDAETLLKTADESGAAEITAGLDAVHFPVAFPEVFLRDRPGFDCVLGNPPYDKVRHEPAQFWVTRRPGLRALSARKQTAVIESLRNQYPTDAAIENKEIAYRERMQTLAANSFEWQGSGQHGHHDLAKLFAERALRLVRSDGCIGYVLPRVALVISGWTDLRKQIVASGHVGALQARNRGGWLFDDVHHSLMFVLLTLRRSDPDEVMIWPDVASAAEVAAASGKTAIHMKAAEVEALTEKCVVPWFSTRQDEVVFDKLRAVEARLGQPGGWIVGTADSSRWDFSGSGPHRGFLGDDSAAAWQVLMTRHVDAYRFATEEPFQRHVPDARQLVSLNRGVELKDGMAVLGSAHPTLVFRYPSRSEDSRTLIATALPEAGYLFSKGYVSGIRTSGVAPTPSDLLALLGLMNSWTCDWWVRRFVDRHVTKQIIENIPLPRWDAATRAQVAGAASYLLEDVAMLPGGHGVAPEGNYADAASALVAIESAVLAGFDLRQIDLQLILGDFSDNGCPPALRARLLSEAT